MKIKNCLICGLPIEGEMGEYHRRCSRKLFGSEIAPQMPYSLRNLDLLAEQVVDTSFATVTGVQKKLSLTLQEGEKGKLTFVGLWGDYILKPPVESYDQLPENEFLTMNLADLVGIKTVPHGLIRMKSGEPAYITRRIDRGGKGKIPMEDMCQLSGKMTEDKYRGSLEQIGKIILKYCTNRQYDATRFYDLVLFCYLTGNGDMHLKNFSLLSEKGEIALAPAYDLLNTKLVIPNDNEETALTLNGKKSRLKRSDFKKLAESLGLSSRQELNGVNRFIKKIDPMSDLIETSFLKEESRCIYKELFLTRISQLI
jgi:serine/threonine-protein kinase HipA